MPAFPPRSSPETKPVDSRQAPISEYEFMELLLAPMEMNGPSFGSNSMPHLRPANPRSVAAFASVAAISFLLFHLCGMNFCDPDIWHEMALFRQSLVEGRVPTVDRFAYTPTVVPSIHHEWGAGAIFYTVATLFGANGLMVFKYSLVAIVLAACFWCARLRGASTAVFLTVAPAMALFSSYGFTTIRAQVFTLAMLSIMLGLLELDQRGRRWWIALWLPLHVLWLNVHAGFVVGAGLMALHACEQIIRRRPFLHFIPVGLALAALVFLNPYGVDYLPYLMHGLTMARPLIVEWRPLWQHDQNVFGLFLISLVPIICAGRSLGWRNLTGILVLSATALAAARHTRHLSIYCVAWACYVPGYLQQTKFGRTVEEFFQREGRLVMQISVALSAIWLSRVFSTAPWQLVIPCTNAQFELGYVCYPVGAVEYLKRAGFHGNLMLPFEVGGYAMWKLHPQAKVSLDGRYEVAYQPGILEDHLSLFRAERGWREILAKYPTDAILVPCTSRLSAAMPSLDNWTRTYSDGVYSVYARTELNLPNDSHDQAELAVSFP